MKKRWTRTVLAAAVALLLAGGLLPAGSGAIARAEEPDGAKLQNLLLDKVAVLEPAFSPDTFSYTAETYYSIHDVTVFPIRQEAGASVTVNGTAAAVDNGVNVPVNTGANTIQVAVQNGSARHTYTVTLTKVETDYYGRRPISGLTATTDFGNSDQLSNLFDGDTSTYWQPTQKPVSATEGTPTSFLIDLGRVYPISRMQAVMSNNASAWENTARGRISVSVDGETWETPVQISGCVNYQNAVRYDLGKIYQARYVKYVWDVFTYYQIVRVNEFAVYEDISEPAAEYPAPEGGDIPFQPTNENISHGQAVVLEQGFPLSGWSPSDAYGRKLPNEEVSRIFGWDGPIYFDPPMTGLNFLRYNPDAHWGLAKAPWGANGMNAAGDPRPFVDESMLPYIRNAVSFCFGDEGGYSRAEAERYGAWFDFSRQEYPGTIVHSNQAEGRGWSSMNVWREYLQIAEPDLLSFDDYYWMLQTESTLWNASNSLLSTNLWKLQRQAAQEGIDGSGQKPLLFGQYLDAYNNDQPVSQKNLVVNLSLLSGMKWLDYFRIEYGNDSCYTFDEDGAPTRGLYEWGQINRYIKTIDDYILRLNNDWVVSQPGQHGSANAPASNSAPSGWHMGSFADSGTKNAEYFLQAVSAQNLTAANNGLPGDVVMGYFNALPGLEDSDLEAVFGCRAPKAFMVMNGLVAGSSAHWYNPNVLGKEKGSAENTRQRITLTVADQAPGRLKKVNRDTGAVETVTIGEDRQIVLELGGGEAELLFWDLDEPANRTIEINDNVLGSGLNQFEYDDAWTYREPDRGDFGTTCGNDVHFSGTDGAAARFRFYGKAVELCLRKHNSGGVVSISLDGGDPVEVDTSAAEALNGSSGNFPMLYAQSGLENTEHILTIRFDRSKGNGETNWRTVSIDCARVTYDGELPAAGAASQAQSYVNDTESTAKNHFAFSSGWTAHGQTNSTNTSWTDCSTAGESYELHFYGTAATIYSLSAGLGAPKVYLDGELLAGKGYTAFSDTWINGSAIDYPRPVLRVEAGAENADHVLKVEAESGLHRVDYAVISQAAAAALPTGKDLNSVLARARVNGFCYEFSGGEQNFDGTRIVGGTAEEMARLKASQKGTLLVRFATTADANQVILAAGKDAEAEHYGAILANAVSHVNLPRVDFPDGMRANLPGGSLRDGEWHTLVYSVDAADLSAKQGKTVTSFDGGTTTRFPDFASWFNQNSEINDIQFLSIGGVEGALHYSGNNQGFQGKIAFAAFVPETFTQAEAGALSAAPAR